MAETTLTVADLAFAGVAYSPAAANTDGSKWLATPEDTFLAIENGGGGSINATIEVQHASGKAPGYGPLTLTDMVVAVGAGAKKLIGPIPSAFIDSSGYAHVTFSGVTSVLVQAFRHQKADR